MNNTVEFKSVYDMVSGEWFTYQGSVYKLVSFSEGSYSNYVCMETLDGKRSTIITSKFKKFRCV